MFQLQLKGRALYRIMSLSCSIVSRTHYFRVRSKFLTKGKAFTFFGYDAGVLGGEPFGEPS